MIGKRTLFSVLVLGLLLILVTSLTMAQGHAPQVQMSTTFTYQGRLADADGPVNSACDLRFILYDAEVGGSQVGPIEEVPEVAVSEGLFTVKLNFGADAFAGDARWLEIDLRCPAGSGSYAQLSPRQALTPAPYALWAADAPDTLEGLSCASGQVAKWNGSAWVCGDDDVGGGNGGGAYWSLTGNAGTAPGTNFLGTTDNLALELRVNGQRALRLEPNSTSPNVVGGYGGNEVTAGVVAGTIGGGGRSGRPNRVTRSYATVAGGSDNTASALDATVGGGLSNTAGADSSTVAGGFGNEVTALLGTIGGGGRTSFDQPDTGNRVTDEYGTVGGGGNNQAGDAIGDTKTAHYATVAGGEGNTASERHATVGGGRDNTASANEATVGGGMDNLAKSSGCTINGGWHNIAGPGVFATVGGGESNNAAGPNNAIGGGKANSTSDYYATVGGGENNVADGWGATVAGGQGNRASASNAAVGGGGENMATGWAASIPGGSLNTAAGSTSFAAGRRAKANADGCFVWGDYTYADVPCDVDNRWVARASGGVYFYTNAGLTSGVKVDGGGNAWSSASARELKENFEVVDTVALVEWLAADVPVTTWNYRSEDASIRHMGPVAEDFYAAFGLGEDGRHISTIDADGVALAAIQGLYQLVQEKEAQITAQQQQIEGLEHRLASLEALVAARVQEPAGGQP